MDFPLLAETAEKQYYDLFVSAANDICAAIPQNMVRLQGEWFNRASQSPTSSIAEAAKTRPDRLFVSRRSAIASAEERLDKLGQMQEDLTKEKKRKKELVRTMRCRMDFIRSSILLDRTAKYLVASNPRARGSQEQSFSGRFRGSHMADMRVSSSSTSGTIGSSLRNRSGLVS